MQQCVILSFFELQIYKDEQQHLIVNSLCNKSEGNGNFLGAAIATPHCLEILDLGQEMSLHLTESFYIILIIWEAAFHFLKQF